jgi:alkaline phosphatase
MTANSSKQSLAILLVVAALCLSVAQAEPKCVLFFIGDGMGFEHVRAGGMYAYGAAGTLCFESFPYQGEMTTHSADSAVTDSAAAGTALATGVKVNNGVVSMAYPGDHSELPTMLENAKAQGKSTGLVTTVFVTHATPATFGAHEPSRLNYAEIANDYLTQTRPNVIFGGCSYMSGAAAAGYTVVTNRSQLAAYYDAPPDTMLSGQFGSGGHMPYEADYDYDSGTIPRLSEMTSTALSILDNDPDGFFLMVEGGRIDHACHANASKFADEVVEFANAVQVGVDWATACGDALIIVTADHETGGLIVLGNNGPGIYPDVWWATMEHTATNVPIYAWGENAQGISGVMDNTELFAVVTAPNTPQATNPSPADGATGVDTDADLSWTPGAGAIAHDVYFGTDSADLVLVSSGQTEPTYDPGFMLNDVTYYWRIDEVGPGGITMGVVWSFTTESVSEPVYRIGTPVKIPFAGYVPKLTTGAESTVTPETAEPESATEAALSDTGAKANGAVMSWVAGADAGSREPYLRKTSPTAERAAIRVETGIRDVETILSRAMVGPRGLLITGLEAMPAAKDLGLKNGDIIRAIDGRLLTSRRQAHRVLKRSRSQPAMTVELLRAGGTETLVFDLK